MADAGAVVHKRFAFALVEKEKKIIAFDDSIEHTFRRASINAAFKGFFNSKVELARMKSSAYLINTSRGPLVDEAALIAALDSRSIGGAGLDVYDIEPLPADHPLRKMANTVLTPHLGYVTEASYRMGFTDAIEDIVAWAKGAPVRVLNQD